VETRRPYTMGRRAAAVEATRHRILAAVLALAEETLDLDPTLEAVARRAGVSVQTVLRHFGTRDALFDAAVDGANAAVVEERATPAGDVDAAVRVLVDHYERRGDFVLHLLGHERDDARFARAVEPGRALHRTWVEEVFAPQLASATDRGELVDLLVVVTDVYSWKLLRRDAGHSRAGTEARLRRLVRSVLDSSGEPG